MCSKSDLSEQYESFPIGNPPIRFFIDVTLLLFLESFASPPWIDDAIIGFPVLAAQKYLEASAYLPVSPEARAHGRHREPRSRQDRVYQQHY